MDVEVEKDDLNQKFLTSLAFEWLMHTIVWRNRNNLDTMSLDDLYNHLKVYEAEVQKKSNPNSQNMAFISSSKHNSGDEDGNTTCVSTSSTTFPTASASVATISQDTASVYIASQSSGSQIKFEDINQIDEDDMEEIDIKWSIALLSMRAYKAPRSQERGRKENYTQGSKAKEKTPKALMGIDGVGWDWSYMANEGEDHALVADAEAPTEFALMANTESKIAIRVHWCRPMKKEEIASWDGGKCTWGGRVRVFSTVPEIWLRVQQMMKGSDIGIQEKKAKLFNEWERFTSNEGESIESYYHRFLKLMNDLKRNKHFPEKIASNLKFLNNLQPEWSQHVTIVHKTKDLHTADYTQLYDFLKYNQKEVDELKAE
nr:ribonuclease H-like domain-containing protein [Tanacetum cinerariifolium]